MDGRVETTQATPGGGLRAERTRRAPVRANPKGRRQKPFPSCPHPTLALLIGTVRHFFKARLSKLIEQLPDPRVEDQCVYELEHVFWLGIVMFCCQSGSREEQDRQRGCRQFVQTFNYLVGTDRDTVTCTDNMNEVWEKMPPEGLEKLATTLTRVLVRSKVLDAFRLFGGHFVVAVDATGYASFDHKHCEHCLVFEHQSGASYQHHVLVARLVTDIGLTLPMAVEFIENGDVDPSLSGETRKQDCERKAFNRLAVKLKAAFPRLPLCIVGDALYADQGIMATCRKNRWQFILVFKEGKLPALFKMATLRLGCGRRPILARTQGAVRQQVRWVPRLYHEKQLCHAVFLDEWDKEGNKTHWAWLASIEPVPRNIWEIVKGGRLRWKVENETFNSFKNGGYRLEHVYGGEEQALKNYFNLLQIAHLLNELVEHGDLVKKLGEGAANAAQSFAVAFGSMTHYAKRLWESLRNSTPAAIEAALAGLGRIQIRFSSA